MTELKPRTLREFAACLLVFGVLLALWSDGRGTLIIAALIVVLGLTGLFRPNLLRPLFLGWMAAIFPVTWLVSNVVLAVIYFAIVTPMGLTFRLLGRDALSRRFEPDRPSYWEDKPQPGSLERYFRQY